MVFQFQVLIITLVASFFGSVNGLGITFLITMTLYFFDINQHQALLWLPYLSIFILSLIYVLSRFKIFLFNIVPIIFLCLLTSTGLLIGKMITSHLNLVIIKICFGLMIMLGTFLAVHNNYFSQLHSKIKEDIALTFSFLDNFVFFITGIFAGFFDLSLAAFVYAYLIFKKPQHQIEQLDVCIYSVLIITSVINFISSIIKHDSAFPGYLNVWFFVALIMGAVAARFSYQFFSNDFKRKFIITALYFLGLKLFVLNLLKL